MPIKVIPYNIIRDGGKEKELCKSSLLHMPYKRMIKVFSQKSENFHRDPDKNDLKVVRTCIT